jgi:multiple sugar transport system substrate-binding protein
MKKMLVILLSTMLLITFLNGCSSGTKEGTVDSQAKPQEPVKLLLWGDEKEEIVNELFAKPLQAKYPYITLNFTSQKLADLVAEGEIPDILIQNMVVSFVGPRENGLLYDLNPLIKKYNFDLNRIEKGYVQQVQFLSDNNQLNALPYFGQFNTMYYNKDIFDKFGVEYPRDGMYWDQVIELAKKMTRTDGGVQYRGLDPENITRLAWMRGLDFVDPKTDQPIMDSWKPVFELLQKIISIPGNKPEGKIVLWDYDSFFKERNVAMRVSSNQLKLIAELPEFKWDMVTYPIYEDAPDVAGLGGGKVLLISNTSKHKDDAFHVIESVLSDEVQKEFNRRGILSVLKDESVKAEFGKQPYLKGKNVMSVFKQPIGYHKITEYDDLVKKVPFNHSMDLYNGSKDINTVIREAQEEMTKIIQQKKAQN